MVLSTWRTTHKILSRHICKTRRKQTTAGVLVIGDEILKGQTEDTNSRYLSKEIYKSGVQVKKISVIGDIVEDVSREVKEFSNSFDYVITTGGIGPTHDDITFEAVAKAFNEELILDPTLKELVLKFYKSNDINIPGMKMAYIPQSAKLNFKSNITPEPLVYPNISVRNVYIFPGIPELMMKTFSSVKATIFQSKEQFFTKCLYLKSKESDVVQILNKVVLEFPDVQFGSYPKLFNSQYQVKLTVESVSEKNTKMAYETLVKLLPKESIVDNNDVDEK
ncbi:FAD synthase [Diabrotica virgifera virgifera]|uniref:FAD synthase-like isoform X1 n=1 Tax=Diabrotica virgifera virgifera TaxID=50390 RepID=A0A6P7F9V0_DIAVI|nr:FAD synthase [Diabrotica virgifera virgifera]